MIPVLLPVDQPMPWVAPRDIAEATGRAVRAERIPDEQMRAILRASGMGEGLVEAVIGMSTGLRDGFVPEQTRDLVTTTPTPLRGWAYDVLRPQL